MNSAYASAERGSQVNDDRVKALYAAQATYSASDALGMAGTSPGQAATKTDNQNGITLQLGIGASSASSSTTTHDETAYGSHIRSTGDVTIAATGGNLNIIGSQIDGNNVALAAANNLNILSQQENHSLQSSNKNASGGVGIQIGSDGVGFYAQGSVGKGSAHGNGTTHAESLINANDTLTLVAGNHATIKGAQLTGNTVIGAIGGNLLIQSEQDTDDYASKQQQLGGKMVIGYGSGGSISYNQSKVNSHYQSVNEVSGIQAGSGGFDITVGGNTHLIGGVIASSADPSKNLLNTGSLTYESIHNEANYSASSIGGSAGYGSGGFSASPMLGVPQNGHSSSDTNSGIAQGTINVRDGNTDLAGLDRNPTLDNQALNPIFDAQKVQENMELGNVAGQVGMRSAGTLAQYMANHATTPEEQAAWSDGGTNKALLHGLVGAATAALDGGNSLQGALGAAASEAASGAMQRYLDDQGITDSNQRNMLMQLASTAIGGAVGGGVGAATALQGDQYNRQLHKDEATRLAELKQGKSPEEVARLNAAACAVTHCADGVSPSDPSYAQLLQLQTLGNSPDLAAERDLLQSQKNADGNAMFQYSFWNGGASDWNSRNQAGTRVLGALQGVGGNLETLAGLGLATTCETGIGCLGAMYLGAAELDTSKSGYQTMINGQYAPTLGGQVLQGLGLSPNVAELIYGATQLSPGIAGAYIANKAVNAEIAASAWARGTYTGESFSTYAGDIHRYTLPEYASGTWDIYPGNVAADHRYSPPGVGAVYAGTSAETAASEVASYGALEGRTLVTKNIVMNNVLDLTNPAAQRAPSHGGQAYEVTQRISAWARDQGYQGILAPSTQNSGGVNLISFKSLGGQPK